MIIGDAPYQDEGNTGKPFSGNISSKIDKIIEAIGIKREDTYLIYLYKCRPVKGSTPSKESNTCRIYLQEQIQILRPKIIITLGNYCTQFLLTLSHDQERFNIDQAHGTPILYDQVKGLNKFYLVPTYNPGNENDLAMKIILDDMDSVKTLLNGPNFFF
jgi:DNA polymerase